MRRMLPALVLGLLAAPIVAQTGVQTVAPVVAPPKAGTYEVVSFPATGQGQVLGLVKITPKGSDVESELVAAAPNQRGLTLKSVAIDGATLRVTLQRANAAFVFEGRVPHAEADTVRGTIETEGVLTPARLAITDKTELTTATAPATDVTPLRQALTQLRAAGKNKAKIEQVHGWVTDTFRAAQPFGPRYELDVTAQVAESLAPQTAFAELGRDFAQRAEQSLTAHGLPEQRYRALNALATAARIMGKDEEAEAAEARAAKLADEVDREYLATNPAFKPTVYEGRKAQSDRLAVMELFTGAQCPPCVAADLAFDGLMKTYKPSDVILLQYHLHIPGPDPMTNPDTEARWAWYRETFRAQMGGVPSTVFNGKPQAGGGGAAAQAERKYTQYRGIIDKLLEEPAGAAVKVSASRQGDTIAMRADVSNLAAPGDEMKLRFVVAEEIIRFVGSNKIRYHHMVVRAMPGGPAGMALTKADSQHSATAKLGETRQGQIKYLDDFASRRPFPQIERPLALSHLKVIALVQDEDTGEILQAAIADLGGAHSGQ